MSSIRPLATITVLAAAGVFLYMKINETEPVLPAGVEGFKFEQSLEFGTQYEATSGLANQTEAFDPAAAGGTAPAYSPAAPTESAPPFNPGAATTAGQAPAFGVAPVAMDASEMAPPFAAAPAAEATSVPDLPPVPAVAQTTEPVEEAPPTQTVVAPVNIENTASTLAAPPGALSTSPVAPTVGAASPVTTQPDAAAQASLFSATRIAVEAALDRGQLSQALLLLSDWYGDPSLSPQENQEVEQLLSQLAGSVIYSKEHRLEPPYMVQAGERLQDIAARYEVPWQLLAKINGITTPDQLQTGQQLKVVRGPFSATIDISKRHVTLMLNRRYAGQFSLDIDPTTTVEEGHWSVNQKLVTPGSIGQYSSTPVTPTEEHSLILSNSSGETNQLVIIRGKSDASGAATDPTGRVIRLSSADVGDVYDILSLGSGVTIRR